MGKATAAATTSGFTFDDIELPAAKQFGGSKEATRELYEKLSQVPVGKSFLVETVVVPPTITDPAERKRTFKELADAARNRATGAIGRFKKKNGADKEYATRIMDDTNEADETKRGVRVWRTK